MKTFKQYLSTPATQEEWEEDVYGPELVEVLKQVDGKWALVSKKTG